MADFLYNKAKGRVAEWAERINVNDPANSVFVVLILITTGIESDAVLKDLDDITYAGATTEASLGGYARKSLNQGSSITVTYDDGGDKVDVDFPDQTWTGITAGETWGDLVVAYDSDSTAGTDANIIPATQHDFSVTPDGSDITAVLASTGFYRAS